MTNEFDRILHVLDEIRRTKCPEVSMHLVERIVTAELEHPSDDASAIGSIRAAVESYLAGRDG